MNKTRLPRIEVENSRTKLYLYFRGAATTKREKQEERSIAAGSSSEVGHHRAPGAPRKSTCSEPEYSRCRKSSCGTILFNPSTTDPKDEEQDHPEHQGDSVVASEKITGHGLDHQLHLLE
ncbi:unnamed protein product [Amoebophrya sp. A120]|nr:unnamed protein product [Amoebophrya sp. A120]|eukprot:GSA120T00024772001.1